MIRRNQPLQGLDQEILDHIEQATLEYIDRGLSPGDARRAALREFGNITLAKEDARAVWIPVWLDQTIQDARYGIRLLLRYPGFTAVVVLTLAMGIGANAAIFTLVNQILLHPPGISHPERLISVRVDTKTYKAVNVSAPAFADVRESRQVFEHTAAQTLVNLNYINDDDPLKLTGAAVSAEWFDVFGAKPSEGRVFAPEEDQPGAPHVVVLAHTTWVQLFGADPKVIGRKVELNQQTYKIIGVMESSFQQPRGAEVWVPLALPPEAFAPKERGGGVLQVVARMRPTMHFAQASS